MTAMRNRLIETIMPNMKRLLSILALICLLLPTTSSAMVRPLPYAIEAASFQSASLQPQSDYVPIPIDSDCGFAGQKCRNDPVDFTDPLGLRDVVGNDESGRPMFPDDPEFLRRQNQLEWEAQRRSQLAGVETALELGAVGVVGGTAVALTAPGDIVLSAGVVIRAGILEPAASLVARSPWIVRTAIMALTGYEATPQGRQATSQLATTISESQQVILRPIEIQFPAKGLTLVQRNLFDAHLAEQEMTLNNLSLTSKADLELNLLNYQNITREVAAARALARRSLPGNGEGLDAAHSLDAVAGGYLNQFAGFRDPVQRYIGSLWRIRAQLIVPGREHRLVSVFAEE